MSGHSGRAVNCEGKEVEIAGREYVRFGRWRARQVDRGLDGTDERVRNRLAGSEGRWAERQKDSRLMTGGHARSPQTYTTGYGCYVPEPDGIQVC